MWNYNSLKKAITRPEELKKLAAESTDAESFKTKVQERCAGYSGGNYLDMTAGFFFAQ